MSDFISLFLVLTSEQRTEPKGGQAGGFQPLPPLPRGRRGGLPVDGGRKEEDRERSRAHVCMEWQTDVLKRTEKSFIKLKI